MTARFTRLAAALVVVSSVFVASPRAKNEGRILMGTVVPKGSLWEESLQYIRQEWRRLSRGALQITIIPGGQLGDEVEMVRQVRHGVIQAVALSSVGLSRIDESVSCLQVPMMFRSYAELDYVRERVAPTLEKRIEAKGFVVLNWGDGGWVHTFSKTLVRTPEDVKRLRLFTAAGDPETERLYKEFGFRAVPLSMTDVATSFQTKMIEAISTVPIFAELEELYKLAPHMLDVKWTPLIGGTVIDQRTWNGIAPSERPALLRAARAAGDKLRGEIRALGDDAVREMEKRGLKVTRVDDTTRAAWQLEAERAYPRLKDRYCPADLFDEVLRYRNEFRQTDASR